MIVCLQVNTRFISKSLILSLSILMLLSSTAYSFQGKSSESNIKSATFVSEMFEVEPGLIAGKTFWDIEFPKGHIGVKSFDAELIDEDENPVPLYETYLHHWFAIKYLENVTIPSMRGGSKVPPKNYDGFIFKRNQGMCHGNILPHYWGLGVESRGTISNLPEPFAVELHNPAEIPDGYQEKWLFNILAIDTRGTHDRKGCTDCRCDLMNLPDNFYNVTKGIYGEPLTPDYKGGLLCCLDNLKCKLREGFEGPKRNLALRYKIRWVDWDESQIPVNFYVLDSTDKIKSIGSTSFHECQVNMFDSPHVQKTKIPMQKGGYLIYGTAHMHSGGINATLYGEDGRTLCTSIAKYGTGNEAGNEKGYAVGRSVCYPKPGSIKIKDGEILTLEARYESGFLTGAMGHMYIYLAERLPHDTMTS
ncbi:uncharacterized protein LOC133304032 [Gastrolobium bilobum]|uniref:uncharacterized protein LOC133304032 n=1 Tax=Gastrolobium bilobum TaxID=150636 RepID=UPI002AB30CBA|nr:uncharacterized protein LOC133304032 [Gastrolobium bilobum]